VLSKPCGAGPKGNCQGTDHFRSGASDAPSLAIFVDLLFKHVAFAHDEFRDLDILHDFFLDPLKSGFCILHLPRHTRANCRISLGHSISGLSNRSHSVMNVKFDLYL
jgi:hypothetical protein